MGTRGAITFVADGVERTVYNHFDSYPSGLGQAMLDWLNSPSWNLEQTRAAVRNLRMVDDQAQPTALERKRYARYADTNVSTGTDWYSLLRETQGEPALILEAGVAGDAKGFPLDSLFCEWAYVVDLDKETFEVYEGFRGTPAKGRWADHGPSDGYYPVSLIASWPLSAVPASLDDDVNTWANAEA